MSTDPKDLLEQARQRQREIAQTLAAQRIRTKPAPAIDDVTHSWIVAVRTTRDYVRALVTGC
jgi:hypothetical protein